MFQPQDPGSEFISGSPPKKTFLLRQQQALSITSDWTQTLRHVFFLRQKQSHAMSFITGLQRGIVKCSDSVLGHQTNLPHCQNTSNATETQQEMYKIDFSFQI